MGDKYKKLQLVPIAIMFRFFIYFLGYFTIGLIRVGSIQIGFEMGWVISGMGDFGSCSIFGSVRLWVGLFRVFGSKSVGLISDVSSGCSVRISGLGSGLPGLLTHNKLK